MDCNTHGESPGDFLVPTRLSILPNEILLQIAGINKLPGQRVQFEFVRDSIHIKCDSDIVHIRVLTIKGDSLQEPHPLFSPISPVDDLLTFAKVMMYRDSAIVIGPPECQISVDHKANLIHITSANVKLQYAMHKVTMQTLAKTLVDLHHVRSTTKKEYRFMQK